MLFFSLKCFLELCKAQWILPPVDIVGGSDSPESVSMKRSDEQRHYSSDQADISPAFNNFHGTGHSDTLGVTLTHSNKIHHWPVL
ncbi:hypothetical protein ElyMa_000501100 [Elysia marginata]|uniref:Uncharacterized protein n=1 Tax=Elysia marginata TaxID=1093978 RepID=A0AAV4FV44_9GAST|nr:hypothetical protein ElyMa_000501100 [Elysia marginata]